MWLFIFVPVLMIIFSIVPSLLDGYPTGGLSLLAGWLAGWLVQLIPELPLSPTLPPLVRQVMAPQSEVIPLVTNTLHMALHCRVGASHYISAISNHDSDQVESKRDLNHIISRDPFSHL